MATKTIPQLTETATILDNGVVAYDSGAQTFKTKASTLKTYFTSLIESNLSDLTDAFNLFETFFQKFVLGNLTSFAGPQGNSWKGWASSGGTRIVVVASDGTNRVATYENGGFTLRSAAAANSWQAIAWSSDLSLYAAVASSGTNNRAMTSPDGITWTIRTTNSNNYSDICAGNGLFVACSSDGSGNRIMTSNNGSTWTSRTTPVDKFYQAVCWNPNVNKFFAIAGNFSPETCISSTDGITWTEVIGSSVDGRKLRVMPNGYMYAIDRLASSNNFYYSEDGTTWISVTGISSNPNDISYNEVLDCYFVTNNLGMVWYSKDGFSFEQVTDRSFLLGAADWEFSFYVPWERLHIVMSDEPTDNFILKTLRVPL
jgi:hypothetical protein